MISRQSVTLAQTARQEASWAVCRLYGFRANEETKVECTLVHAQNALMVQSRADLAGKSHAHGWGIATYGGDHQPHVERQAWAAYHGEHFRRAAAGIYSTAVLAHVRRATVGPAAIENTHPFQHGRWAFAHNGTVPAFAAVRDRLLAAMTPGHRAAISGVTDSEHIFRYLMSCHERAPERPIAAIVASEVPRIAAWSRTADPAARIGLNIMLTDGEEMAGTRWGRTLYYSERDGVYDCEICGFPHIHHDPHKRYRAVVVASEPITHERWREMPEISLYRIDRDIRLHIAPLEMADAPAAARDPRDPRDARP